LRVAVNIAKLPELLRGGRPTAHKTSAACFIVRDHALAETIVPVQDGR
jgi:hypothetical protein